MSGFTSINGRTLAPKMERYYAGYFNDFRTQHRGETFIINLSKHPIPGYPTLFCSSDPNRSYTITPISKEVSNKIRCIRDHVRAHEVLSPEEDSMIWKYYSESYQLLSMSPSHLSMVRSIARIIKPFLPERARLLDIGSGTGAVPVGVLSQMPIEHFGEICLVEKSPSMMNVSKKTFGAVFGDNGIINHLNCTLQDVSYSKQGQKYYIEPGFDSITSCLLLPFIEMNELVPSLTGLHGKANPGTPVVHVIHKQDFNQTTIQLDYIKNVLLKNIRGSRLAGLKEIATLLPSVMTIRNIVEVITSGRLLITQRDDDRWGNLLWETGVEVNGKFDVFSGQATLWYGRTKH